jgi:hypothetical protein
VTQVRLLPVSGGAAFGKGVQAHAMPLSIGARSSESAAAMAGEQQQQQQQQPQQQQGLQAPLRQQVQHMQQAQLQQISCNHQPSNT